MQERFVRYSPPLHRFVQLCSLLPARRYHVPLHMALHQGVRGSVESCIVV